MDKPTKPSNLIPRSFGGVKNNFSSSLQSSGYEDGVPAIYGGDNLNYQLDATGKELDYCEKICDYINNIPINKTPIVDANNKLVYTQYDIRVYSASETYYVGDYVTGIVDGVKHIYQSLQNNNIGQSLSNETYWKKVDIISDIKTIGRNIGEIIPSTIPLTDAGLHLLDGARLSGDGIYKDFIDYIASIYDASANYFCTESEWQQSYDDYGVCGKFVYDSVANTVRLPKYSNKIYTQELDTTAPVVGNGMSLGITNGTVNAGLSHNTASPYHLGGATTGYGASVGANAPTTNILGSQTAVGITSDASYSGIIAQLSDITTALDGYYYIVVATTTKTSIQVDIDEIATDLNNKIDKSNLKEVVCVVEKFQNGKDWYRVWSDGWCEQGGFINTTGTSSIVDLTLLKTYINSNYTIVFGSSYNDSAYPPCANTITNHSFTVYTPNANVDFYWQTCGFIS